MYMEIVYGTTLNMMTNNTNTKLFRTTSSPAFDMLIAQTLLSLLAPEHGRSFHPCFG